VIVLDASALIALLIDAGHLGDWVAARVDGDALAAPELALFETANILRRQQLAGRVTPVEATLAHEELRRLPIVTWPYPPLGGRVWQLRNNLTTYDAAYVAVAELVSAPLVTLDLRLGRASGPTCQVLTPPPDLLAR
jgi:predicted nucleic acid-binding protein